MALCSLCCLWLTCGIFLVLDEVSGTPALEGLYLQGKHQVHAKNGWKTLYGVHMSSQTHRHTGLLTLSTLLKKLRHLFKL